MADGLYMGPEIGVVGVPSIDGISQDRRVELRGPDGIKRMVQILREEPAAYTVNNAICLAATRSKWSAVGASDKGHDRMAAEYLQSILDDMSREWSKTIRFLMGGVAIGFADLFVVYKRRMGRTPKGGLPPSQYDDQLVGLRKLAPRRQETIFRWEKDKNGDYRAMIQNDPDTGVEFPPVGIDRMLHFTFGSDRGDWEGIGWLEPAYRIFRMIVELEIIYGIGAQRTHVGLPVFEYKSASPSATLQQKIEAIARNLIVNQQQFVTYPAEQVAFRLESVANSNAGELREQIRQLRWELMSLCLLQSLRLGNSESGARALADPMLDLFRDSIDSYNNDIVSVFNRHLVPRLMRANPTLANRLKEYPQFTVSSVTDMPLSVIQFLAQISAFLGSSTVEDGNWLRSALGMELLNPEDYEDESDEDKPDEDKPDEDKPDEDKPDEDKAAKDEGEAEPKLSHNWANTLTPASIAAMQAAASEYRSAARAARGAQNGRRR